MKTACFEKKLNDQTAMKMLLNNVYTLILKCNFEANQDTVEQINKTTITISKKNNFNTMQMLKHSFT